MTPWAVYLQVITPTRKAVQCIVTGVGVAASLTLVVFIWVYVWWHYRGVIDIEE